MDILIIEMDCPLKCFKNARSFGVFKRGRDARPTGLLFAYGALSQMSDPAPDVTALRFARNLQE
ncbi:MAG: hypothetical protein ACXV8U_06610 [Methylobacter sp.]